MKSALTGVVLCALAMLTGCAGIPAAQISYYLPMATPDITVTQTMGCKGTGDDLTLLSTATAVITPQYVADPSGQSYAIDYADFGSFWSSGNATVNLTPDGRLQSINDTTTGSGSDILTSVMQLASVAMNATGIPLSEVKGNEGVAGATSQKKGEQKASASAPLSQEQQYIQNVCNAISAYGTKPKDAPSDAVVTLIYDLPLTIFVDNNGAFHIRAPGGHSDIEQEPKGEFQVPVPVDQKSSGAIYSKLGAFSNLPFEVTLHAVPANAPKPAASQLQSFEGTTKGHYKTVNVPTMYLLDIKVSGPYMCGITNSTLESHDLWIPGRKTREIPIPHRAIFGSTTLMMTQADSGLVTSLTYANTSGAKDIAGVVSAGAKDFPVPSAVTTSDKAAQVKAQADLIYEQQRLVQCQQDSTKCSSN